MQSADHLQEFLQDNHAKAVALKQPSALASARPSRHGLYVQSKSGLVLRDRKVRRLLAKVRRALPWLEPSDDAACRAWCELEILSAHVFADIVKNGATTASGDPRRLLSEYRGLRGLQLTYERELGMTPSARAALGIQVKTLQGMSAEDYAAQEAHR